jgi:DNA-binding transcriptional LysR family regulator
VLAAPLVTASLAVAPTVHLDIRPSGTLDLVERFDRGDLDLAIGGMEGPAERFALAPLFEDPFVMVVRRGHPASRRKLTAAALAALPHLDISSSRDDTSFIDRSLAERALERRIALRAPYLSAAAILAQTDMVATLSRRVAQELVRDHPLQIVEPPFDSPRVRTAMMWHRRLDGHPAHRWLRELVLSVAGSL